MNIIVTIIPTDLVTNSLLPLFALSYKPKHESSFQQVGGLVTINITVFCLFFCAKSFGDSAKKPLFFKIP